jgi:hypothetical protein
MNRRAVRSGGRPGVAGLPHRRQPWQAPVMLAKTGEGLMTAGIGSNRIYDRSVDVPQLHGVQRQRSQHGALQTQGVLGLGIGSRRSTKSII